MGVCISITAVCHFLTFVCACLPLSRCVVNGCYPTLCSVDVNCENCAVMYMNLAWQTSQGASTDWFQGPLTQKHWLSNLPTTTQIHVWLEFLWQPVSLLSSHAWRTRCTFCPQMGLCSIKFLLCTTSEKKANAGRIRQSNQRQLTYFLFCLCSWTLIIE